MSLLKPLRLQCLDASGNLIDRVEIPFEEPKPGRVIYGIDPSKLPPGTKLVQIEYQAPSANELTPTNSSSTM
jgi:hypothetical protein